MARHLRDKRVEITIQENVMDPRSSDRPIHLADDAEELGRFLVPQRDAYRWVDTD
jgi:hypothetical protein